MGCPPHLTGTAVRLLGNGAASAIDCGGTYVYLQADGGKSIHALFKDGWDKVLFKAPERRGIPGVDCDSTGTRIAFVLSSEFNGPGDVYIVDLFGGRPRQVTSDKRTKGLRFSNRGNSLIVGRKVDDKMQAFELSLDGQSLRRLVFDAGPDVPGDISRDGTLFVYTHDLTSYRPTEITVDASGRRQSRTITQREGGFIFMRPITNALAVAGTVEGEIVTLGIETGILQTIGHGFEAFPSFDRASIFYSDLETSSALWNMSLDGSHSRHIADLPGPIVYGTSGPDGEHVLVSLGDTTESYVVTDGKVRDEHLQGIVSVAPDGGWRAVTNVRTHPLTLSLIPPDSLTKRPVDVPVWSYFNRWLDNHRIGFCTDKCWILDVVTGQTTPLPDPDIGMGSTVNDNGHVLSAMFSSKGSLHLITNFAER